MIERYRKNKIEEIWSDKHKLELWQEVELVFLKAMVILGLIKEEIYNQIEKILKENPIDLDWWKEREREINHDLAAFVDERRRFLPPDLQMYFHMQNLTSYDDEEPAFALMMRESVAVVKKYCAELERTLTEMAIKYRFVVMVARTHGQWAELQTFGKRCLTWLQVLRFDLHNLERTEENLRFSKMSGAIGNYGSTNPNLEKKTLEILGLKPYYGATQIMPREVYAPTGQALSQILLTIAKIGIDIRLGARSGMTIYQEPFGSKQKGSSAMPHKKNSIKTEQGEGMGRLGIGGLIPLMLDILTWEERAIEQSSVERVDWPDLFHETVHSLETINKVLKGLAVYPDNMLLEVVESRGCYASSEAKEILGKMINSAGLSWCITAEDVYRIIQLAAFNVFEPTMEAGRLRNNIPQALDDIDRCLLVALENPRPALVSIKDIIARGELRVSSQLEAKLEEVEKWNRVLKKIFRNPDNCQEWEKIFQPSYLLRNEARLYREILDI